MFAKAIIDSDAFLDMPVTARLLYYDLSMRADDDGFVNSPKKIMRMIGASQDDMSILVLRKFILPFDNGVVVIKHWRIHNYIRRDTYIETPYKEQKAMLECDENKAYRMRDPAAEALRQRSVDEPSTQDRLGKERIGKVNIESDMPDSDESPFPKKPVRQKYGKYNNVLLSDEDMEKLKNEFPSDYEERIERLSEYIASSGKSYKSHLATIRMWARKDKPKAEKQGSFDTDEFFNAALKKSIER